MASSSRVAYLVRAQVAPERAEVEYDDRFRLFITSNGAAVSVFTKSLALLVDSTCGAEQVARVLETCGARAGLTSSGA